MFEHILITSIENDNDRFGRSDISYRNIGVVAPDFYLQLKISLFLTFTGIASYIKKREAFFINSLSSHHLYSNPK